jgi:hypothetical protein
LIPQLLLATPLLQLLTRLLSVAQLGLASS